MPTTCQYAIVPDGSSDPAALFEELEDAINWGLHRYGGDAFQIRHVQVETGQAHAGLRAVSA